MTGTTGTKAPNGQWQSTTAVNCEKEGHCLHNSTDPQALWCCKCSQYFPMTKIELSGILVTRLREGE